MAPDAMPLSEEGNGLTGDRGSRRLREEVREWRFKSHGPCPTCSLVVDIRKLHRFQHGNLFTVLQFLSLRRPAFTRHGINMRSEINVERDGSSESDIGMQHHRQLHRPTNMRHRERNLQVSYLRSERLHQVRRKLTWMLEMSFDMATPPAPLIMLSIAAE